MSSEVMTLQMEEPLIHKEAALTWHIYTSDDSLCGKFMLALQHLRSSLQLIAGKTIIIIIIIIVIITLIGVCWLLRKP